MPTMALASAAAGTGPSISSIPAFATSTSIKPSIKQSPRIPSFSTEKKRLEWAWPWSKLDSDSGMSKSMCAQLLQNCGETKAKFQGEQVHGQVISRGLHQEGSIATQLVSMYANCGSVREARLVFDSIPWQYRSLSLWNAMIRGCVRNGFFEDALFLYIQMPIQADNFTFSSLPIACAGISSLPLGQGIHAHIIKRGFESNAFVDNSLISMYSQCRRMDLARKLFEKMPERSLVSWSAMIAGYAQNLHFDQAVKLFREMQYSGIKANVVTVVGLLPACGHLEALQHGKELHSYIVKNGFQSNAILGSSLLAMYSQSGKINVARQIFDKMPQRSVFSWNAMIAGFAQAGRAHEASQLFWQMTRTDVKPDLVTIVSVLPACAHLAALQQGKEIHGYTIKNDFESPIVVGNALIDMYSKCGCLDLARNVFGRIPKKNEVSWTAMIAGYGMNGYGRDALTLFKQMQEEFLTPNHVTFVAALSSCSHSGLLTEGRQLFESMSQDYKITPRLEHYACMVDLLARAGCLDEAVNFIHEMPVEPNASMWGALLGACRIHGNVDLGQHVAERLLELEANNEGNYVLLSNIYAAAGRWDDVDKVRTMMKIRGLKKTPGCSWIEVKNRVHQFVVGDKSHPRSEDIYAVLESLATHLREAGYVPDIESVLRNVNEEEKESILAAHSEKLAIAFGLINTSPGTPIRVTKNLRMCGDCHSAIKFISKIVSREIIVRDINRFHHFKDGMCFCGDYW